MRHLRADVAAEFTTEQLVFPLVTDSRLPAPLLIVAAVVLFGGFAFGPNFGLASYAIAVLLAAVALLWRPGEPPVMLMIFVLQWLQASVKVFNGNLSSLPVNQLAEFGGDIALSSALSLTGLLVLAIGMRLGAGKWNPAHGMLGRHLAKLHPPRTWFTWYLIALLVSFAANELAGPLSALSQPLLALGNLKWAFFFMFTYAAFRGPWSSRQLWAVAAMLEFVQGIGGYFADFKTVIFYTALGIAAAGTHITLGRTVVLGVVGVAAIYLAILWTVVKGEYRDFVNGGQAAQVVEVDYGSRVTRLSELVTGVDARTFSDGVDTFMNRLSYVDFFAAVVEYVPSSVGYTKGAIWWDAVLRPFMPRVFFPGKTIIDDSERTALFTGMNVYGADRGVSISIGYMGESYIDFGAVGMMLPILALGYLKGRIYRWLALTGPMRGILGFGLATASLMSFSVLESSITKVFGGFVAVLLVIWLLNRFIAPRYLGWLMPARAMPAATATYSPTLR